MSDASFDQWLDRLNRDGFLDADMILRDLFVHLDHDGSRCLCSCHPSLGSPGLNAGSDEWPCTKTAEEL